MSVGSILAIDPGSRVSGIIVLSFSVRPKLLANIKYTFASITSCPTDLVHNLNLEFGIRNAFIEDQFMQKNVDSLKKLSRNAGRWQEACAFCKIPVEWVNAKTWQSKILKKLGGNNRAGLKKAAQFVAQVDTGVKLSSDCADAYCIGKYGILNKLLA